MRATRAGVYGRNSKGEAKSIEDQLDLGREAVAGKGWMLAGEYQDDSSASLYRQKERENWARLITDLHARKLDVVVLWKIARGSRDEIDWFPLLRACAEMGILIHVLADRRTYDPSDDRDWKTLADEAVNASYYARALSKDVRRGVDKAAAEGRPHGRPPLGYTAEYDDKRRPRWTPNERADTIREIFARLDAHTPIITLVDDLRARDVPGPTGPGWHRNSLRAIARNRAYAGIRRHRGTDYPAQWAAIVPEAQFWRVQALLSAPERRTTRPGSAKWLLTNIAQAPCGGRLGSHDERAGHRPRLKCLADSCVGIVREDLDAVVERLILARLALPNARGLFARDSADLEQAQAEQARYEQQLEEARQSFEAVDGISAEALARKERALAPLIEDAKRRARPDGVGGLLDDLTGAVDPGQVWAGMEIAAKRSVVRHLAEIRLGPSLRRFSRWATPEERAEDALMRLDESRWVGDDRTWRELRLAG
ncbi:recombinase family protein [Actinoplanes awajinensis]|uniref:Recombinase family protein n=1 Tax=Actinoplanes awajinensis subsp. mycoplanecinus TaxID=135947 RepID=A0A101J8V4_9ACTN|nr:recombinase family protein [Actinoplanes awajinensis]KUL22343.1 hypothetical protein ADL15_48275 [Actinoplanes awajinensis subsp. mycoplanecinus]